MGPFSVYCISGRRVAFWEKWVEDEEVGALKCLNELEMGEKFT